MKEIKLFNRYRDEVVLVEISQNKYELRIMSEDGNDFADSFITYSMYGNDEDIFSVDPSGGPYISIGKNVLTVADSEDKWVDAEVSVEKIELIKNPETKAAKWILTISNIKKI